MEDQSKKKYAWLLKKPVYSHGIPIIQDRHLKDGEFTYAFDIYEIIGDGRKMQKLKCLDLQDEEILCDKVGPKNQNSDYFYLNTKTVSGKECSGEVGDFISSEIFQEDDTTKWSLK